MDGMGHITHARLVAGRDLRVSICLAVASLKLLSDVLLSVCVAGVSFAAPLLKITLTASAGECPVLYRTFTCHQSLEVKRNKQLRNVLFHRNAVIEHNTNEYNTSN